MLKCARTRATVQHEGAWHHRLYRSPEHWNSQRRRADLEDVKNYFRLFGRHYDKAIVADMQAEPLRHLFLPASYCSLYPRQSSTPHLVALHIVTSAERVRPFLRADESNVKHSV